VSPRNRESRSRQEFEQFVAASVDGLLRAAFLISWDLTEAEDLVQECLVRVAQRWPRVRGMEYPTAYARKILVNLALDEGRRRIRQRNELQLSDAHALDEQEDVAAVRVLGWVDTGTDLTRALAELAPRQRATLVLRYFDDLSETRTAEVMGCSVGTVKSTTAKALQHLREIVEKTALQGTSGYSPHRTEGSVSR
jgi:RNA polymerase sigma-70 factor (sigma-E family)